MRGNFVARFALSIAVRAFARTHETFVDDEFKETPRLLLISSSNS